MRISLAMAGSMFAHDGAVFDVRLEQLAGTVCAADPSSAPLISRLKPVSLSWYLFGTASGPVSVPHPEARCRTRLTGGLASAVWLRRR